MICTPPKLSAFAPIYRENQPFPHVVIDGAFDTALINKIESEINLFDLWDGEKITQARKESGIAGQERTYLP
jgi:hypothetical protein